MQQARFFCSLAFILTLATFSLLPSFLLQARPSPPRKGAAARRTPPRRTPPRRPAPRPARLTRAQRIVEQAIKASGGRKALQAVRSILATGKITLATPLGPRAGKIVSYAIKPNYQRIDMTIGKSVVIQSFHPGGGWFKQNSLIFTPPKAMLQLAREEEARVDLELRYLKEKISVRLLGSRRIRGRLCSIVVFQDPHKRRTTYYIDKKKHLILKRSFVGPSPLGQGKSRFSTYQGQFRPVTLHGSSHKTLQAFHIENYMDGKKLGVIRFQKILLNSPKVKPSLFQRPRPID